MYFLAIKSTPQRMGIVLNVIPVIIHGMKKIGLIPPLVLRAIQKKVKLNSKEPMQCISSVRTVMRKWAIAL